MFDDIRGGRKPMRDGGSNLIEIGVTMLDGVSYLRQRLGLRSGLRLAFRVRVWVRIRDRVRGRVRVSGQG